MPSARFSSGMSLLKCSWKKPHGNRILEVQEQVLQKVGLNLEDEAIRLVFGLSDCSWICFPYKIWQCFIHLTSDRTLTSKPQIKRDFLHPFIQYANTFRPEYSILGYCELTFSCISIQMFIIIIPIKPQTHSITQQLTDLPVFHFSSI